MKLNVKSLSNALGAEVTGLDLTRDVSVDLIQSLKEGFLKFHLLCIRLDPISSEEFVRFARHFGVPQKQLLRHRWDDGIPEVSILNSTYVSEDAKPDDLTKVRLSGWHTDDSYFLKPAKTTLLQALAIPDSGGQTFFINTQKAYREMPGSKRNRIKDLLAVHSYDTKRAVARAQNLTAQEEKETHDVEHPLVRTHEDTGIKAIYFNPNRTDSVVGFSRSESDKLLDDLHEWLIRPEFQYHHEWRVGDLLIWDNRCLLHSVNVDYPVQQERRHQRILLKGERPT